MEPQTKRILRYLKAGKGLTPLGALSRFNCFRLAPRIWEIRREGIPVETTTMKRGKKRYALYRIAA